MRSRWSYRYATNKYFKKSMPSSLFNTKSASKPHSIFPVRHASVYMAQTQRVAGNFMSKPDAMKAAAVQDVFT